MNAPAREPQPRGPAAGLRGFLATPFGSSAPDVRLPLRFLVFGILSLLTGVGLLVARPELLTTYHYHQTILSVTHLFVLGFVLSVVTGAMYQLVPVALETTLWSERLARWHFPVHVVSVAGMVWAFWVSDMKQVGHFGSGLALGVGFFVWNLVRTLLKVRGWTVVSFGIASALVWLTAVIAAGLALAAAKSTYELVGQPGVNPALSATLAGLKATADFLARFEPLAAMHAHAHLGVLGVFVIVTVGVAYKLVPMFLISEIRNPLRAWASLWLLNAGLAASFLGILRQSPLKPLAAATVIAGLVLYGLELVAIVRTRKRLALDWGLRGFLTSQALLVPTAALGALLSRPGLPLTETTGQWENAYGFLAILGVVGFAILGMLYKILPFLVWFAAYSREVGRSKTPTLQDMVSVPVQAAGYWLWLAGLGVTLAGILAASGSLARGGALLLAGSLLTFVLNAASILSHLVRPRMVPLPARTSPPPSSSRLATLTP